MDKQIDPHICNTCYTTFKYSLGAGVHKGLFPKHQVVKL